MHPTVNRIALVCPYTCACDGVLRAPPFKAPSKAHFLIPFKGLIPLILINTVSEVRSNHLAETQKYLAVLTYLPPCPSPFTHTLANLFPTPPPLHLHPSTIPRCDSLTSFLIQPSARILVACAHSRFTIPPHYLCASSLLAPIHLPK